MTVVALAHVEGIHGRRPELVALMRATAASARAHPGCLAYDFTVSLDDPDHLLLVAEWHDEPSLRAYYRSDDFAAYQQGLAGLLARPSELRLHHVERTERPTSAGDLDPRLAD